MARIVIATDKKGRRFKVTEEQAKARGYTVLSQTSTAEPKTKSGAKKKT